jgi:hypothetical protein
MSILGNNMVPLADALASLITKVASNDNFKMIVSVYLKNKEKNCLDQLCFMYILQRDFPPWLHFIKRLSHHHLILHRSCCAIFLELKPFLKKIKVSFSSCRLRVARESFAIIVLILVSFSSLVFTNLNSLVQYL